MNKLAIILGVIALFLIWWNLWISIKSYLFGHDLVTWGFITTVRIEWAH